MRFKHALACARPADCSPQLQPMLLTPRHGSLPSGHSTQAYVIARVLQELFSEAEKRDRDKLDAELTERAEHEQAREAAQELLGEDRTDFLAQRRAKAGKEPSARLLALDFRRELRTEQLMRQAARVAINRTVAGVHYPVDSTAGRVLGVTLAEYFIARCKAPGTFQARQFNGEKFDGDLDFNPGGVARHPKDHIEPLGEVTALLSQTLLGWLWGKAKAELDGTEFGGRRIA